MAVLSLQDQIDRLVQMLQHLKPPTTQAQYVEFIAYCRDIPASFYPAGFELLIAQKFNRPLSEVQQLLGTNAKGPKKVVDFDTLVPKTGWLHDYIEYTRYTEPPTVFHFFAGATIIGSTLSRRVCFPKGSGDVYPNVCAVLVAPSGRCKKTTACNLAVSLFRRIGGNVLADKVTPEAIVDSFKTASTATGLIYAPEWAVFLGKQQYMEGLVPMLTALFDCPEVWTSSTIARQTTTLNKVALSHLACSTIDWMQTSISKDAFGGGFMSRLLFIVQHDTPRRFALPPPLDTTLGQKLQSGLLVMQQTTGKVTLSPEAEQWYVPWYDARTTSSVERHFAGYFERKPDRLLQLAMVLNSAVNPKNLIIDLPTLQHALSILDWIEHFLPSAFSQLSSSAVGDDQHMLLKQLRAHKGELGHSEWLRMNTSRMNADTFRKYLETLIAAKFIVKDVAKSRYYLLPAGWAAD